MSAQPHDTGLLEHYVKKILAAPVYDLAVRTPLQAAPALSVLLGNKVLLKREDLQPTFSFKIRGAYNKLMQLTAEQKARGVVTASAGNHAQGVALAARVGDSRAHRHAVQHAGTQSAGRALPRGRRGVAW